MGPHAPLGLDGVEIFTNSSGSHHELRKLQSRMELIVEATRKNGGCYIYANQKGCDGDRLYYDGSSMIVLNGKIIAMNPQFSLKDVEVLVATIDLEEIRSFRCSPSRGLQSQSSLKYRRIPLDTRLSRRAEDLDYRTSRISEPLPMIRYHQPEEEIALSGGCWLVRRPVA